MDKKRFILLTPYIRQNAIDALLSAPDGYSATISPPTRSTDQNSMFHAICSDVAKSGYKWAGETLKMDEWKVLLVCGHTKATDGEVKFVPGLEGEFVNLRESTARMSVKRATSLIEYALAWCHSHNIPLTETRRQGFIWEQAA